MNPAVLLFHVYRFCRYIIIPTYIHVLCQDLSHIPWATISKKNLKTHYEYICQIHKNNNFRLYSGSFLAGLMRSFIRDCSDGKSFYDTSLNEQFENRLKDDNQTSCVYKGTSDIVCITLCKDNFCNGPLLSSTIAKESVFALILLAACVKWWFWMTV